MERYGFVPYPYWATLRLQTSQLFLQDLSIHEPDYYLEVGSERPVKQITMIRNGIQRVLDKEDVDIVFVQGNTNTTMAAALADMNSGIPIGHIEAGYRLFNKTMPEELNGMIIDSISVAGPHYGYFERKLGCTKSAHRLILSHIALNITVGELERLAACFSDCPIFKALFENFISVEDISTINYCGCSHNLL